MSENKTKQTENSVEDFLHTIENEQRKKDAFEVVEVKNRVPIIYVFSFHKKSKSISELAF